MKSDSESYRSIGPTEATLDAPPAATLHTASGSTNSSHGSQHSPRHVALVEGSGPELSGELYSTLQKRLRVASLTLCAGFVAFLIWHTYNYFWGTPLKRSPVLLGVHLGVCLALGGIGVSLCRKECTFSNWVVRIKEAAVFGIPGIFFLMLQYEAMTECLGEARAMPSPAAPWLILIFTYALFIPNTWHRAALPIAAMALTPVIMTFYLQQHSCPMTAEANTQLLMELCLLMCTTAGLAVVGVRTIGSLRKMAFEAAQLGQYRLKQLIGSGGMGEVYLAEHKMMKRPCALKIIRPEKAGDPRVLARFEREVRTTAKLSHWNSIDIYDYGQTDDGIFYYVMEYLPGMNLKELVETYGPLPAERVIYLLRQTCDALREAHDFGLVHRDIKPANVFAARRGGLCDVAKLLDFGLAKPLADTANSELTQEGTITGSPLYMSPEQATGDSEPDARSDIYSLGAVAYFTLTGQPPFDYEKPIKLLVALAKEDPVPLIELQPNVPEDLAAVVMRCLEKDPEDRFQTAHDLGQALDDCQAAGLWDSERAANWWVENTNPQQPPQPVLV